jgi:EAL domain-containing protein (putative c-di-GMP-specific phosphodiesterase class I)
MPKIGERHLAQALESGQLSLVYQPKIVIATGAVCGVEALARWQHPDWGAVPPGVFIPLIEASDLIHPFTDWVIATATADWARWARQGLTTTMAINVSARNLARTDLPDIVEAHCRDKAMPCHHLTVELTETATENAIFLLDTLSRFRIKEIDVSLDDFGTGHSSAARFDQLPFSEVKIDRTFVLDADIRASKRDAIAAIVEMASAFDIRVVAEGVETEAILKTVGQLGCEIAQGYHIARPMAANLLPEWASVRPHATC